MAECGCGGTTKIIYACSGAADVGEISDRVARTLRNNGFGNMTCLAAIGAHLSGFIESAKAADENITIDGCPVACARKNLEHIGVTPKSYILTEMGLVKGKTEVSDEIIEVVCSKISSGDVKIKTDKCGTDGCGCGSGGCK